MRLKKSNLKKLSALLMGAALIFSMMLPGAAFAAAPSVTGEQVEEGGFFKDSYQILRFTGSDKYVENITAVSVNETEWEETGSKIGLYGRTGAYYRDKSENVIYFDGSALKLNDTVTVKSEGCDDITLTVKVSDGTTFKVEMQDSSSDPDPDPDKPGDEGKKEAPEAVAERISQGFYDFQSITIKDDNEYVKGITEIDVNGTAWREVSSTMSLFGSGIYYLNSSGNQIYFDGTGAGNVKEGNIITIKHPDYQDLVLQVTAADAATFSVKTYGLSTPGGPDGPSDGINTLFVRLAGFFESAVTGQKDYDAISGATTSVSTNKNSNVTVQAAVMPNGQEPSEDDWEDVCDSDIRVNSSKTTINIDSENSGMSGVYSTWDSSLTLSGTPAVPGEYPVSVTLTDENGRTTTSNELIFKVYSGKEKLIDQLTLENAEQTSDGKYMYDMEPWVITEFSGDNETVTVPAEIKAWYGSHTSGTYGELGYAVSGEPVQTLIVPEDCNLTLVNMKILSSVRIVVEDGGRLVLRDSSVHGNIEVMDGGSFSMNYDDYSGEFLTGASINGQLILNDGAALENASIYSNTNNLPNGNEARHNVEPVVLVKGNVTVDGQVFIRGDEAPTGTDGSTGKSYSGQPALKVENGTLNITKDSVVAAYGGGKDATTSVGGTAVVLDGGTIAGDGKLIAVGGNGTFDDGGNAVTGTGTISVKNAYLEGGSTFMPKSDDVAAGTAVEANVTLAGTTNRNLIEGNRYTTGGADIPETYWKDITTTPDLSLYTVDENAPGEDQKPDDNNDPETGDKTPGSDNEGTGGDNQEPETDKPANSDAGGNNQNGKTNGTEAGNSSVKKAGGQTSTKSGSVQTGDYAGSSFYVVIMVLAAAIAAVVLKLHRA